MKKCKPGCGCVKCTQAQRSKALRKAQERARGHFSGPIVTIPTSPVVVFNPPLTAPNFNMMTYFTSATSSIGPWATANVVPGQARAALSSVQESCTGLPTELALGSVFAWRRYRYHLDRGYLAGARVVFWPTSEMQAVCLGALDHAVPDLNCTCGIYAFKERSVSGSSLFPDWLGPCVDTVVECWGTTLIGEKGIRTANARIVAATIDQDSLILPGISEGALPEFLELVRRWLETTYSDVRFYDTEAEMLQNHPLSTILSEE